MIFPGFIFGLLFVSRSERELELMTIKHMAFRFVGYPVILCHFWVLPCGIRYRKLTEDLFPKVVTFIIKSQIAQGLRERFAGFSVPTHILASGDRR
jgi:hypothetical protein